MARSQRDVNDPVLSGDHILWEGTVHQVLQSYGYRSEIGRTIRLFCHNSSDGVLSENDVDITTEDISCLICLVGRL